MKASILDFAKKDWPRFSLTQDDPGFVAEQERKQRADPALKASWGMALSGVKAWVALQRRCPCVASPARTRSAPGPLPAAVPPQKIIHLLRQAEDPTGDLGRAATTLEGGEAPTLFGGALVPALEEALRLPAAQRADRVKCVCGARHAVPASACAGRAAVRQAAARITRGRRWAIRRSPCLPHPPSHKSREVIEHDAVCLDMGTQGLLVLNTALTAWCAQMAGLSVKELERGAAGD